MIKEHLNKITRIVIYGYLFLGNSFCLHIILIVQYKKIALYAYRNKGLKNMLNSIKSTLLNDRKPPVILPKWKAYNEQILVNQLKYSKERISALSFQSSPFYNLFLSLINSVDRDYMLSNEPMIDKFTLYLKDVSQSLERRLSPLYGMSFKNTLFRNEKSDREINEIFIPVERLNYFSLPFEEDYVSWKHLKPIRVWYHDSPSFPYINTTGQYKFKESASTVVYLVDVKLLIMMWIKYYTRFLENEEDVLLNTSPFSFLRDKIYNDTLNDLTEIWILNEVKETLYYTDPLQIVDREKSNIKNSLSFLYGSFYQTAMTELFNHSKRINTSAYTPIQFSKGLVLPSNSSLYGKLFALYNTCNIPQLSQYRPFILLRDLDTFDTILSLYERRKDLSSYRRILIQTEYALKNRYINPKVWEKIPSFYLREKIKYQLDLLEFRLHL